ncbi:MAG TPA: class II aldolase/adducin family protein [Candidatus Binatia bacterium]|nr:class II aldolase/adducin family protein [Candidatus Binatia bacterium]
MSKPAKELVNELIVANHILFDQKIVDAFGHISVRHDKDPNRYLMSRHLAPGLVTADDIVTFDLESVPHPDIGKRYYSERFLHGEIYKVRPDVVSVIHCHAPPLLPFGVTKAQLQPIYHMSAFLGTGVPTFEIREKGGMTNMLIRTPELGKALAEKLADKNVIMMRGHGATMVGPSIKAAVYRAIYSVQNAQIQLEAMRLGEVTYLAPEEAELYEKYSGEVMARPWALWEAEIKEQR